MEENTWDVIDSYFRSDKNVLTKHHIDSFNDFVYTKIPNTIRSLNPFVTIKNDENTRKKKHEIRVYVGGENGEELFFDKPQLDSKLISPNEARLKNATYKSDLIVSITVKYIIYDNHENVKSVETRTFENIKIGTIPIMLHSKLCLLHKQPDVVLKEMGECVYDQGGYMIVDGKEKVIIAQERIATNRLFLNKSKEKEYTYEGLIRCITEEAAIFPKTLNIAVYSDKYAKGDRKNAIVMTLPNIKRQIPIFVLFRAIGIESDKSILEHIVYDVDDEDKKKMVDFLYHSMRDGAFLYTQEQALEFLKEYVVYKNTDYVRYIIMNDLFPNMNEVHGDQTHVSLAKKALFLGHVAHHIVKTCLGWSKQSDRDSYAFKRVDLSGFLMANLFRDYYNQFRNHVRAKVDSTYNYSNKKKDTDVTQLINGINRYEIFDYRIIQEGLIKSLKGSWGSTIEVAKDKVITSQADPAKAGIVQDLSRISYIGAVSHMRRVNTPVDRTTKIVAPHRLHSTQFGAMCPCESPDGASIGLLKNFALLCHVSFDCSSREIVRCLKDLRVRMLEYITPIECNGDDVAKVLVNSNWVGITTAPDKLAYRLRLLRRNALINVMTSVSWNIVGKEININTEAGRCCRPLFIVQDNKLRITDTHIHKLKTRQIGWYDLIKGDTRGDAELDVTDCKYYDPHELIKNDNGDDDRYTIWKKLEENQSIIEFVDVEEANTTMVAMEFRDLNRKDRKFTHCELHPSTMFAVLTANIPFADHNQAPRNYFSGQQGKQSISVYNTAFNSRMDIMSMVLHYPQKALVNTRYMHYIGNNALPHGVNTIVAIMCYTGFNQEDSLIINRGAIDKGLFHLTYYKTIMDREDSDERGTNRIIFENPAELTSNGTNVEEFGKRFANYSKLDDNGFPKLNEKITEGDVYLGKCGVKTEMVQDDDDESIFKAKKKIETYKDKSLIADKNMAGIIDKVYVYEGAEGLKTAKIRMRKTRVPVLGDKHGCYSSDTEILTNDGWKEFRELKEDDKVATLVGNRLVYQVPTERQVYDHEGRMYKLSSNQVELLVTDNHRMYVRLTKGNGKYRIEEAKDVYRKIRHYKKDADVWTPDLVNDVPEELVVEDGKIVKFKIKGCTDEKTHKVFGDLVLDIKAWLVFFGIWIAEGCTLRQDYVSISAHKPRVKEALLKVCETMGLKILTYKDKKDSVERNIWNIVSKPLVKYIYPLSVGAICKTLPNWVWSLTRDLCDDLITGMCLGDGDFGTVPKGRYYTSSFKLADDFQRLCLHAGYSTNRCLKAEAGESSTKKDGSVITLNADYYCLSVITKQNEPKVNKYMYAPDNNPNDEWVDYKGKVYCCTVPEGDGILYVRRVGFGVWSGNSRHAQKGTVGMILPPENMPFTKDGLVPDIIINPHAIPTRMTIAHLVECVLSKLGCVEGRTYDGTPFCNQDIEGAYDRLEQHGFEKHGNEMMYNGVTGEQIPTDIFIGPTYYLRMKHMVDDKINMRGSDGTYVGLTRQPVKSRAKGGAGRVGEMEMSSIISHGISSFLKESMMERSDKYDFHVDEFGAIAVANPQKNIYHSLTDPESTEFSHLEAPFSTKLFFQELESMSIVPRVICDEDDEAMDDDFDALVASDEEDDDDDA